MALTPYADGRHPVDPSGLRAFPMIESVVQSLSNGRAELIGCIFNYVDERASITESMATELRQIRQVRKETSTAISAGKRSRTQIGKEAQNDRPALPYPP